MAFKHDKNNSFVIIIFDLKLCLVHAYNHYVYHFMLNNLVAVCIIIIVLVAKYYGFPICM